MLSFKSCRCPVNPVVVFQVLSLPSEFSCCLSKQRLSTPMVSPSVSKEAVVGPREEAVKTYMGSADESSGIFSAPVRVARRFSPWGRLSPWWSRTKSYEAIRGRSSTTNLTNTTIQQYNNTITTPIQLQQQQPTTTIDRIFRGNGATPSSPNLF